MGKIECPNPTSRPIGRDRRSNAQSAAYQEVAALPHECLWHEALEGGADALQLFGGVIVTLPGPMNPGVEPVGCVGDRPSMMRNTGAQQVVQGLRRPPAADFKDRQVQQERLGFFAVITSFEQRDCLRAVPSGQPFARPFLVEPALCLESRVRFAKVMEKSEGSKPREVTMVEATPSNCLEGAANGSAHAQCLKNRRDVRQMIDQRMPFDIVRGTGQLAKCEGFTQVMAHRSCFTQPRYVRPTCVGDTTHCALNI